MTLQPDIKAENLPARLAADRVKVGDEELHIATEVTRMFIMLADQVAVAHAQLFDICQTKEKKPRSEERGIL